MDIFYLHSVLFISNGKKDYVGISLVHFSFGHTFKTIPKYLGRTDLREKYHSEQSGYGMTSCNANWEWSYAADPERWWECLHELNHCLFTWSW